jgi:hypothetical protein
MKTSDLLTMLAMAVLGYVAFKAFKGSPASAAPAKTYGNGYSTEIANSASPGDAAWGWNYYTDGTVIGPDGSYYKDGNKIWSPSK